MQSIAQLDRDNLVHRTREVLEHAAVTSVVALGGLDLASGDEGGDRRLVTVNNRIPEVDENVEELEGAPIVRVRRLHGVDDRETKSTEVTPQRLGAGSLMRELPALGQERAKHPRLVLVRVRDMHAHRLIVKISAVRLELRDQGNEQAPVELGRAPSTPRPVARGIRVHLLELVEAWKARRLPFDQCLGRQFAPRASLDHREAYRGPMTWTVGSDPGGAVLKDYHINVFYSEEDGGYVADIPDLEACSAFGATPEEALGAVEEAKEAWLAIAREEGRPIPDPRYRPAIHG